MVFITVMAIKDMVDVVVIVVEVVVEVVFDNVIKVERIKRINLRITMMRKNSKVN